MARLFPKIMEREDTKKLIKEILNSERYNKLTISLPFSNNYFMDHHYAIFLIMDALIKFDIIIEDENLIEEYILNLRRILKKMNTYQEISKGINLLIIKTTAKRLNISNYKTTDSKEKILNYIYKKYITEGYFYYGISSSNKKELNLSGIKKEGFILDFRLNEINEILKRYEQKNIIKKVESDITDNFVIACYFAFLGPDYLEKFATSGIFNEESYDTSCFYTKDVHLFKKNLDQYMDSKNISKEDQVMIINNFMDIWKEDNISSSHGCIAFIKRSYLRRNYLKDIEEILECSKNKDILESVAMILESRYGSYDLEENIPPIGFEIVDIPSYQSILGQEDIIDLEEIEQLKKSSLAKNDQKRLGNKRSYGFASVFMLAGILLISLGVAATLIVGKLGG